MTASGKTCRSHLSTNPNLEIIFEVYLYDTENSLYLQNGRSGLLKVTKYLLFDITNDILEGSDNKIFFDHTKVTSLTDYTPFHADLNIEARLPSNDDLSGNLEDSDHCSDDDDPYIVEAVIDKRFHRHRNQYEFLVKWVGYSDTTWEIASNIPSNKITEYEISHNPTNAPRLTDTPYDLRRSRKSTLKEDYIETF